MTRSVQ